MILPEKLTPIPGLDRSLLPAWIADFGTAEPGPDDEHENTVVAMTVRGPGGEIIHVTADAGSLSYDDTFWVRYAEPMVNSLGGALFEAEHPGMTMATFLWESQAGVCGNKPPRELSRTESAIIARRKELTWTSPIRVYPD